MTQDEKLAAILAAVQVDPGKRGLARDPVDNLFTACRGDFHRVCSRLAGDSTFDMLIDTGFYIPTGKPAAYETDGPLGSLFLMRAFTTFAKRVSIALPKQCATSIVAAAAIIHLNYEFETAVPGWVETIVSVGQFSEGVPSYELSCEHVGRATDGKYYSMRGRDITEFTPEVDACFLKTSAVTTTIAIGDGGNEIGMGKIPHETIVKNIPNGDLIHCRVPTDHLIVAGVSNWGAYALAAGVYVLRGVKPPADLFDPDREREILEVMVREGPLVDGVTGKQTATVDGLTWDEYIAPLVRIREILES